MMYSLALPSSNITNATPVSDLKASPAGTPKITTVDIQMGSANVGVLGLGRPGNDGSVAQTTPTAVLADDPSGYLGQTMCATTWTTAPTVPTQFFRRGVGGAAIQAQIIWTFPRGLVVQASRGLVLWNLATNVGPFMVTQRLDE